MKEFSCNLHPKKRKRNLVNMFVERTYICVFVAY